VHRVLEACRRDRRLLVRKGGNRRNLLPCANGLRRPPDGLAVHAVGTTAVVLVLELAKRELLEAGVVSLLDLGSRDEGNDVLVECCVVDNRAHDNPRVERMSPS
jgi:hypothetical protein